MAIAARRGRRTFDIWPGFVDALATLLIIVLFLLMVFTVAQNFLSQALVGSNNALDRLNKQVAELAQMLQLEQGQAAELRRTLATLSDELRQSNAARDNAASQLAELMPERDALSDQARRAASALAAAEARVRDLESRAGSSARALSEEQKISAEARAQVDLLNQQLAALRQQLARIAAALDASEAKSAEQQAQIVDLGKRLNAALASKVEELARYRSEFFGRLREALGNRPDIRIVGDRFVFQSEVLFPSASADLQPSGKEQIARLAATLKEISAKIPKELNWVLRVDGHTDRLPIKNAPNAPFPSNWELSTARAISVVKYLVELGIPPERLAATGFGEYQPIDPGSDEVAFRRNRRIELKLTER
jgi:chemotaxis protein MotB